MRFLKKFFPWIVIPLSGIILLLYMFDVEYLLKAVRVTYLNGYKTAFLDDFNYFDNRIIENETAQPWDISKKYNEVPPTQTLVNTHSELKTIAFLIIKNDSIWHESYFDGYDKNSHTNSFSIAKSYVSAALGKAIMEGKIKGLDQPVSDFIPEFSDGLAQKMTVGDLSSMASGLNWDEKYYSPFSVVTRAYFDDDLKKVILNLKTTEQPGQRFKYSSGDTQLLAMIIEKATGESLTSYISKHFWKPLGSENKAFWQVDNPNGIEKAYCCIASNARDFARLGKLYKQKGNWNGNQILDSTFVELSTHPRFEGAPYGYGFWLSDYLGKEIFYMRGHLGQFVIVIPEDDLIIVRLGHLKGNQTETDPHSDDFYVYIDETYKMLKTNTVLAVIDNKKQQPMKEPKNFTEQEWKERLTDEEYYILRQKGTERAFTGKYWNVFEDGTYHCTGCENPLFSSDTKFDAHCGWPSFDKAIEGSVIYKEDLSFGMKRVEVLCAKCDGHLGHVFDDGPKETTGMRYCINSVSVKLEK